MHKTTEPSKGNNPPAQAGDATGRLPRRAHPAAVLFVGVLLELALVAAVVGVSLRVALGAELRYVLTAARALAGDARP